MPKVPCNLRGHQLPQTYKINETNIIAKILYKIKVVSNNHE